MDDFLQHFLSDSVGSLRNLSKHLDGLELLTGAERANVLRILHTIKGTSQTFGLISASDLAGRLESLLGPAKSRNRQSIAALVEGIEHLVRCLEEQDVVVPTEFFEKIPESPENAYDRKAVDQSGVPAEMLDRLSLPEKRSLSAEILNGSRLIGLDLRFQSADFASGLRDFRELVEAEATIIATFPADQPPEPDMIGFQMLLATSDSHGELPAAAKASGVRIIFDEYPEAHLGNVANVISRVVAHGQDVAAKYGKKVSFEVSADEPDLSAERLKLVFDVLLHIVRNAVDHAFTDHGTVRINLKDGPETLSLSVSDDGCGIDPVLIRAAARDNRMVPDAGDLSDEKALELIFRSEFSTALQVTEISGRGVGLNAVKNALDSAGGTIGVRSEIRKGTVFEIALPK